MSDRSQLEEINIRDLGVIEEASLPLASGFTVFSGETGAGKTMVLTALSLVLGGKGDASLVRQGRERLTASATFSITDEISQTAVELGAAVEDGQLILTRTMNSDGRSKSAAGGVSVPSTVLSQLSGQLIEIHGQAANLTLNKPARQRELLDRFAGDACQRAVEDYGATLQNFQELKKKLSSLRKNSSDRDREMEHLRDFAAAFSKVKPQSGEFAALLLEISRLSSVEALRSGIATAAQLLDGEESGALASVAGTKRALEGMRDLDSQLLPLLDLISESYFLLNDATQSVHRYLADLDMDPERLEAAHLRRAEIAQLLKRFAGDGSPDEQIAQLMERFETVEEKIADLSGGEERLASMEKELQAIFQQVAKAAQRLSKIRQDAAQRLSVEVTKEIHALSMPHTRYFCSVESPDYEKPLDEKLVALHGCDEITMAIQVQKDGAHLPIAKAASGGELSRIMLALEVVLAESAPVGTYIFDEVDAGVGGKAAIEVGRRLHALSRHAQVIVVTHLAQVAAWADSHFVLHKTQQGAVNLSSVTQVSGEARIEEIARMLAGHENSASAREHASELLAMRD